MPADNASTVAPGEAVSFPENGPRSHSRYITRVSETEFKLAKAGTYQILFQVGVSDSGQLVVAADSGSGFEELDYTLVGRNSSANQISEMCLVKTCKDDTVIRIQNPIGNSSSITITPDGGGSRAVSAHLVITRLK